MTNSKFIIRDKANQIVAIFELLNQDQYSVFGEIHSIVTPEQFSPKMYPVSFLDDAEKFDPKLICVQIDPLTPNWVNAVKRLIHLGVAHFSTKNSSVFNQIVQICRDLNVKINVSLLDQK